MRHRVICRSCKHCWWDGEECPCECVDGQELPYEDWIVIDVPENF